jgi:simple sugar transport system permease protein
MRKFNKYALFEVAAPLVGFLVSMLLLLAIAAAVGEGPADTVDAIWKMTFAKGSRVATMLSASIPLYIAGIAVAIAFRADIFNIGVEGQYFVGGLSGAIAGIYIPLPPFLHIPVVILFAMAGGALWAAIPALLKVKRGIHEVITTIMFNSIALAFVNYLVNGPLSGLKGTTSLEPRTERILPTAVFQKLNPAFRALGLDVPDNVYLDYSLIVAVLVGIAAYFVLFRLKAGFELRAVGTSREVSRYAGINVKRVQLGAFLASGAIAGLVGLQEIFAIRGYYTFEIASGLGLDGIAIALIGKNSPLGVVFSAFLFAFLKQAGYGLQIYTRVSNSVIYVIQGLMILIIVVTNELVSAYIRALRKKEVA